jgi:hypothetical protein
LLQEALNANDGFDCVSGVQPRIDNSNEICSPCEAEVLLKYNDVGKRKDLSPIDFQTQKP